MGETDDLIHQQCEQEVVRSTTDFGLGKGVVPNLNKPESTNNQIIMWIDLEMNVIDHNHTWSTENVNDNYKLCIKMMVTSHSYIAPCSKHHYLKWYNAHV